jgi:DMSO/TMAO reductase YedYZ molybdopterin-dependent catalytic subunit
MPYNAETPLPALLDEVTDSDLVYVRNHFDVPKIDASDWMLELGGAVESPQAFSLSDITALPAKTLRMTLECAGNGRASMDPVPAGTRWGYGAVSAVEFSGTPLSNLLDQAGISKKAAEVVFHGADKGEPMPGRTEQYVRSLPLDVALKPDTILAWEMNGAPLSMNHGYPLRLVVPSWYGMASVKWLNQIIVSKEIFSGFFQDEQYVYVEEEGTPEGEPVRSIRVRSLILDSTQKEGEMPNWTDLGRHTTFKVGGFFGILVTKRNSSLCRGRQIHRARFSRLIIAGTEVATEIMDCTASPSGAGNSDE